MVIVILILEVECPDWCFSCNSVKLPAFMKNARLLTLLFDRESDDENGLKPNQVFLHNPNLLNAVCLDQTDSLIFGKHF